MSETFSAGELSYGTALTVESRPHDHEPEEGRAAVDTFVQRRTEAGVL